MGRWRDVRAEKDGGVCEEEEEEEEDGITDSEGLSLCPPLHSIQGRICSWGSGCLNLGKLLNKTCWRNAVFRSARSSAPFSLSSHFRESLSSRLAAPPSSPPFDPVSSVLLSPGTKEQATKKVRLTSFQPSSELFMEETRNVI